ncbi:MAG TPA: NAD(P)/FAD-dependent oxidoreductase, partial [Longimicrobiales bacterium]|nr:NAD(P)/FAD-dependent oxidoreductase [Longimicrobiales bacterium]
GGVARRRGGSGMLTVALARCIEDRGGQVFTDAAVDEILVEGGRAVGVRVRPAVGPAEPPAPGWPAPGGAGSPSPRAARGEVHTARAVVAATHAVETFHHLLPEEHRPDAAREMDVGNGFGAMLRLALREPVRYRAHPGRDARVGLQLLCRDRRQINAAYGDYLRGDPARDPPLVAMTFSAVDDSLAPPGGEVLWLWGQYYPYELAGGRSWDRIGDAVADSILDTFERYAPGTRDAVVGSLFQHPLWLERELGLVRGNVMHLEMRTTQMFALRPFAGMARYRGPVKAMYLTGASTHPGGGIMGASGRNAARVVLKDLEKRRV